MTTYRMQGTPTQLLINRQGQLRAQRFGAVDDLRLGMEIGALVAESAPPFFSPPSCHARLPRLPHGPRTMYPEHRAFRL